MSRVRWGWVANGSALVVIVGLAALPFLLQSQAKPAWQRAAEQTAPTSISGGFVPLPKPQLSALVTPAPTGQPAAAPKIDTVEAAALVAGEDQRLRFLIHHIGRLIYPTVLQSPSQVDPRTGATRIGLPTLVLPGPSSYTITDLHSAGAVLPLTQGGYILVDNVLVGPGATLTLGGAGFPLLLMARSATGFTSLVTWGGALTISGASSTQPLTIIGWDQTLHKPAIDDGQGRPYIRDVGGRLDLQYVKASSLGFWSGRTGGVAWTGISSHASTGSAVSSVFTGNTYGAFVARSSGVVFTDDLFETNDLDGLRLHRNADGSKVTKSAAARNGGNGFVVSRGATGNSLNGDLAIGNGANGFLIDGMPLVAGASPSGDGAQATIGTVLDTSEATGNARTGILVEGGSGTVVARNIVCASITAIAVRAGAINTFVARNEVTCGGRVAMSVGPQVTGTTIAANLFSNARIGLLIHNSAGVRIIANRFTGISVFGISVRGASPGVVGNDNVIAGRGFQAIDTRGGAVSPSIVTSDVTGWQHRSSLSLIGELRYHPILTTWLVILVLVFVATIATRFRLRPARPYRYTVPWRPSFQAAAPVAASANGHAHASAEELVEVHQSEFAGVGSEAPA